MLSALLLASCSNDTKAGNTDDTVLSTTDTATSSETTSTTASTSSTVTTTAETTAAVTIDTTTQQLVEEITDPGFEPEEKAVMSAVNDIIAPTVMNDFSYEFAGGTPNGIVEFYTLENYMIYEAESILDDRILGIVTDEQDAAEKGRYVYLMGKGQDYIDWLEKEPAPEDGIAFTRDNPPFLADYYEEYDVWRVRRIPPSWTRSDGEVHSVSWSEASSYILIRGIDGKVLGTCINH